MNKRISVGVAVALVFIAVTLTFTVTMIFSMRMFDEKVLNVKERAAMYSKLSEIDDLVRRNHYFPIDEQSLYDAIARGYIAGAGDPDAQYLTSEQFLARSERAKGTEVSIGFVYERDANGYIAVTSVHPETSAAQLGLVAGDVIVKVGGEDVLGMGYDEAAARFAGAAGDKLQITFTRDGEEQELELTRSMIETRSVYLSWDTEDVAYIRFRTFNDTTAVQFETALARALASETVRGIVFDLRGTDGGYKIEPVASMLDRLMPTGTIISGSYADGLSRVLYTSDEESVGLPVAVIVNGDTTGFAELFAGVLGDRETCWIVGKTTAGKGTLQKIQPLSDGSYFAMTEAVFSLPVSGVFDGIGLKPDYETETGDPAFVLADGAPDQLRDAQLRKAVEVVRAGMK